MKELCKELGIPCPIGYDRDQPRPAMVHPIDEGILGAEAVPMTTDDVDPKEKTPQSSTSGGTTTEGPVTVKTEDVKPPRQMATQFLGDSMLRAMEGTGDEDCTIVRIKRGRDPFYDLTKDDDKLHEAIGFLSENVLPDESEEEDDLSQVSIETNKYVDHDEAKRLLTQLADQKAKEANTIQELAALTGELNQEQLYDTVQSLVKVEREIPEMAIITEEYDYEASRLILAAGCRMRQVYDHNMGNRVALRP